MKKTFIQISCLVAFVGLVWDFCDSSSRAAEPRSPQSVADFPGISAKDWPWWRGPNRDGIADDTQRLPTAFGPDSNLQWKTAVPGRGHGAAIVVGQRVFLATADEAQQVQSLLCLDRTTGKQVWKADIHTGNFVKGGHDKSSHASSTPASDGQRVFINFPNNGAIYTTAVSLEGEKLWQTKVSDYVIHQGYGSSPAVYGPLVIVMADNKGGGAVAGLNRETGDIVWKQARPKLPNYPSPAILNVGGRDQVLLTGCDLVTSFDPLTGKKNWEFPGATTECVTTTVTDGRLIFTSGGYPRNHISAILADGSGKVVWENNTRVYVPSMLVSQGRLVFITDAGVAMIRDAATGKDIANLRLGGTFDASPVLVGDMLYAINEEGEAFVLQLGKDSIELVSQSKIGDESYTTPTICGGQIFLRVATLNDGRRSESLYCFSQNAK